MAINYLPGFEPDFDVKQELRFIGGMPDLHQFDYVYISCSGGKDSHAMAYVLAELATMQNYDKRKMELIYADTGLEWHDTFEQVKRIGTALGIKAVKVLPKYKLLDNVRRRWAKFNGLPDNWQENRNEGGGTDRQTDRQLPAGKTEIWHPHSPTKRNGSATAITSEIRSSNMSVPKPRSYVLPELGKTISSGTVYQSKISGGGGGREIVGTDHFQVNTLNSAQRGASKPPLSNMPANPFPQTHRRFCTGEGKNNTIHERVRNENKTEGG